MKKRLTHRAIHGAASSQQLRWMLQQHIKTAHRIMVALRKKLEGENDAEEQA